MLVRAALALCLASLPARADEKTDWLAANGVVVRTIDPSDVDFSDLAPLAAKIGGARVVQLGESTHGDGATFTAKTRLVKFLHESMGFDVVAWESGLYDVRLAEAALHRPGSASAAAGAGIFDIWANAAQCAPLFEYARSTHGTGRPLVMAGLDPQFLESAESGAAFSKDLGDLLGDVLPAADREFAVGIRAALGQAVQGSAEAKTAFVEKTRALLAAIDRERPKLLARRSASEIDFLRHALEGLVAVARMMEGMQANLGPKAMNPRAEAMASNVAFLADELFRGKKIVVWSNTFHQLREPGGIEVPGKPGRLAEARPMGHLLAEKLGLANVYTIAFVTGRGKTRQLGTAAPSDIPEASAESFEGRCRAAGKPFLFVDLRSLAADCWLRQPLLARTIGHQEMRAADWGKHVDAFFYMEEGIPVAGV